MKLREFCLKLENVIGFITAESIANDQLETSKEQKELLDGLLTNLVST